VDEITTYHQPVLKGEVLELLLTEERGSYVDCTIGGGGHARGILEHTKGRLIGIDSDQEALNYSRKSLSDYFPRLTLLQLRFGQLDRLPKMVKERKFQGFLFDLGLSWHQINSSQRGFSYLVDGPLDMRMDLREEITAAYLVNELSALELKKIFLNFGQERWADRIARFITEERRKNTITSTTDLVQVMARAIPAGVRRKSRIHFATRVFLALRIAINKELEHLAISLDQAFELLASQGRICVISYHSLEDRIVKQKFKETGEENLKILTKKIIRPSGREIEKNPRARSAKLRVAEKICKRK